MNELHYIFLLKKCIAKTEQKTSFVAAKPKIDSSTRLNGCHIHISWRHFRTETDVTEHANTKRINNNILVIIYRPKFGCIDVNLNWIRKIQHLFLFSLLLLLLFLRLLLILSVYKQNISKCLSTYKIAHSNGNLFIFTLKSVTVWIFIKLYDFV